ASLEQIAIEFTHLDSYHRAAIILCERIHESAHFDWKFMNRAINHRLSIFALALLLALMTTRAAAQEPPKQDDEQAPVRLNSTLVQVPAIVTDRAGKFVTDLTKTDFAVYEDGKRQEVALFTAIKQPFNAVLV